MKQRFFSAIARAGVLILFGALLLPQLALAYLDAGTGSQILQIAIASVIGVAFVFKSGWQRIKILFRKLFPNDKKGE